MAIDKAIDSSQLDTDLTSVANAIRTKGGTSASLAFPADFVSAIAAIPSGGTEDIKISGVDKMTLSLQYATLAKNIVIDATGKTVGISSFLRNAKGANDNTEVTINAYQVVGSTAGSSNTVSISNVAQSSTKITKLTLNTTVNPVAGGQFMTGSIKQVLGTPIKVSDFGGTGQYKNFNSTNLTEFYLVPNCADGTGSITTGVLVDASLVSVANALKAVSGKTLTITNATTKARCGTLMGTVTQVTDGGETYDFFTQDAQGTVSLTSFITTTKGWTLA